MTQSFSAAVEASLQKLMQQIEDLAPEIEADLVDSVLTLQLPDGSTVILNRQEAVSQIWLACSDGPARFDRDPGGAWRDPRSGATLQEHLGAILSRRLGRPITLED
ncbi:iron donor protein CyaY [Candidatus Igneacidithiobacillus taiwanensis]|uniref:iron donor protein CyaY n=1 Tax=Candidatus Igneacidithiobacillus taiwanensis TaxID=1945924 RepID=UPI00289E24AD|nr:iron donor protein CyaY [Candidatus Igneacidithiobacillus taiwanensis]